ncbi:endolytic transglycosylase MltG [Protaetiibacter larvae]|uniref:Endolytic murein transglycosylase n=1 Tax=Protaetiibacter larvae TaxID=2592654 RepID=A0A5C1YBA3_9MICO|nr:endolytic transglycosylase MltG [Protaetiibacter larvae]QEO10137.1 endolytic transglycosylase MltG [Protaetiibacter larvae]
MVPDPDWDDIFRPATQPTTTVTDPARTATPSPELSSRRALREAQQDSSRGPSRRPAGAPRKRRRSRKWIGWLIATIVIVGLVAGAGVTVWTLFEDRIRAVLGIADPIDYSGTGNGTEVTIVIESGDIGSDIATKLHDAGVTMTFDAFYQLLLANPDVTFEPGNFRLQQQMSAAAALAALQDPANKIVNQVTIPEGVTAQSALELIASATSIPVADLQAEAANFAQFGVPANAKSIEGYLFPATYDFDPGITAVDAIRMLVDKMTETLDAAGVAPENRFTVLTMASIIQRESGPNAEDMPKIARVFQNRLDRGMHLQSDATIHYGLGDTSSVWTTQEQRDDASNPWNTYANPGLPVGPIGLPGAAAIDAAVHPADGGWLYFVTVNLKTGETVFSNTLAEHERAADQLYAWCKESDENAAYCG